MKDRMDLKECWADLIAWEMADVGDPGPLVASTLTEIEATQLFDTGYGDPEGVPFTAWTATRVYFPCEYDGAERVGSAPRHPCDERTAHL